MKKLIILFCCLFLCGCTEISDKEITEKECSKIEECVVCLDGIEYIQFRGYFAPHLQAGLYDFPRVVKCGGNKGED